MSKSKSEVRTMDLPVKLTTAEVLARGQALARAKNEHTEAKDDLESKTESWKGEKKTLEEWVETLDAKMRGLARVVDSGQEYRAVEVFDRMDYKAGKVETFRADTDELVGSRGMTEAERQRSLFKPAESEAGETKGKRKKAAANATDSAADTTEATA